MVNGTYPLHGAVLGVAQGRWCQCWSRGAGGVRGWGARAQGWGARGLWHGKGRTEGCVVAWRWHNEVLDLRGDMEGCLLVVVRLWGGSATYQARAATRGRAAGLGRRSGDVLALGLQNAMAGRGS